MNDYVILNNLFENRVNMIDFQNFEESNVIKFNNNNNRGNYDNNILLFNTQTLSSKLIDYSNAYILKEYKRIK